MKPLDHDMLVLCLHQTSSDLYLPDTVRQALSQALTLLAHAPYLFERLSGEDYVRARIAAEAAGLLKEFAKQTLDFYSPDPKVSELYDEDDDFASALNDLIGPDFEYPDWSHKTVGEVLESFK